MINTAPGCQLIDRVDTEAGRMAAPERIVTIDQSHQSPTMSAIEAVEPNHASNHPWSDISTNTFWLLLLVGSIMFTLPCVITFSEVRRRWQHWREIQKMNASIPCRTCHFYTNSMQLHCAVHPCTVLTRQAVNCPDYRGKATKQPLAKPPRK